MYREYSTLHPRPQYVSLPAGRRYCSVTIEVRPRAVSYTHLHGFNCRGSESIFKLGLRSNPYTIAAFFAGVLLLAAVLFIPGLTSLFQVAPMTGVHLAQIVGLAFAPTFLIQIGRGIRDLFRRKK